MKSHLSQSPYDTGLACLLWLLAPLLGLFIGASIIHSLGLESRHSILASAGLSVGVLWTLSVFAVWVFKLTPDEGGLRGCTFPDIGLSIIVAALMIPLMGFVSLGVRQLLYNESVNPQVEMVRLEGRKLGRDRSHVRLDRDRNPDHGRSLSGRVFRLDCSAAWKSGCHCLERAYFWMRSCGHTHCGGYLPHGFGLWMARGALKFVDPRGLCTWDQQFVRHA